MQLTDEEENWRDVLGRESRYEVSNLGRVRSKARVLKAGATKRCGTCAGFYWVTPE